MKKKVCGAFTLLLPFTTAAMPVFQPSGPNLTYGAVSNGQTIASDVQNPAASAVALEKGNRYRLGLGSSAGAGLEFGKVDNLIEELDELSDALDQAYESVEEAEAAIARFDALLVQMGREGYVKAGAAAHLPPFPLVASHSTLNGSVVLDLNAAMQSRLGVLDDELRYNPLTKELETKTALYLKRVLIMELSLAYSRPMGAFRGGRVYGGARARYLQADLDKTVVSIKGNDDTKDALVDFIKRGYDQNDEAYALDAGLLWVTPHYRLGATVANLNSPALAYRTVGRHCDTNADCILANSFGDQIDLSEHYVADPQLQLEAATYSDDRNWVLAGALDANPVQDPVAGKRQWGTASVAYATDNWVLPGYRFGYRANLAGTKMTYLATGFTLFNALNFDIAYGLNEVEVDNERYPRSLMINLGLELTF